jgi:hypothetical protein
VRYEFSLIDIHDLGRVYGILGRLKLETGRWKMVYVSKYSSVDIECSNDQLQGVKVLRQLENL